MGRSSRLTAPNLLIALLTCIILIQVWSYFVSSPTQDELALREIEEEYKDVKYGKIPAERIREEIIEKKKKVWQSPYKAGTNRDAGKPIEETKVQSNVASLPVASSNTSVAASGRKLVQVTTDEEFASRKAHMDEICKK